MEKDSQLTDDLDYGILHELLGHLLRHAFNRGQSEFAEIFVEEDITPLQFMIVELIAHNPQISHSAICAAMQTAASVVTTTIKPLIVRGRIIRAESMHDKRKIAYALSPEGEGWFMQLRPKINRCEDQLAQMLTVQQRQALVQSLQQLCGLKPTR